MANYSRGRNEMIVGAVAAAAVIIFVAMFVILTDRGLSRHRSTLYILLPSADKLKKGDPVLVRGVPVGEVRTLDFAPNGGVVVTLRITRRLQLTEGAHAALVGKDLFGSQAMVIEPGEPGQPQLRSGDTLGGAVAHGLSTRLEVLGDHAQRLLGDTTSDLLHQALSGTAAATVELRHLASTAQHVLGGQAANLSRAVAGAALAAENLGQLSASDDLTGTMRNLELASARLAMTAANMDTASVALASVLQKVDRGHGALGRLVNDPVLYEDALATVSGLAALALDIRQNPKRYLTVKVF